MSTKLESGTPDTDAAIEAVHNMAGALKLYPNIKEATADNDHQSCELIFTLRSNKSYVMRLEELE